MGPAMSDDLERLVEELERRRAHGETPESLSDPALEALADGSSPEATRMAAGAPGVDRWPRRLAEWLRRPLSLKLAVGWTVASAIAAALFAWAIVTHVNRGPERPLTALHDNRQEMARGLFAKVATPSTMPPRPPEGDSQNEIRAVLDAYKRAIETKDVAPFQRARPDAQLDRVRASFAQSKYQTVDLRVEAIEVTGDEARVRGQRHDVFASKEGKTFRNLSPFVFTLKRGPSGWTIVAVN